MNFGVFGSFELPRLNGIVDSSVSAKRKFWKEVESEIEGLSGACGCYIFASQNKPWYVGKAERQTFAVECFKDHKINRYNSVLTRYKRAAPDLYLIPKLTPSGRFSSTSDNGHRDVTVLESILIGLALSRNSLLTNISGTKFLKEMNVPGILNTRRGQGAAYAVQEIRSLFDL